MIACPSTMAAGSIEVVMILKDTPLFIGIFSLSPKY